jgi:hypothetical protein|tara:strand:+ start:779 stop:1537 length:759 start_codon:yes stop_codon:yes gene_type:complete
MSKNNIFFFGDSYCEYNENWVKKVSNAVDAEVQHLGTGGAGISHLLETLHNTVHKIEKDDYVVVCLTDQISRFYFADLHLLINHLGIGEIGMTPSKYIEGQRIKAGVDKEYLATVKGAQSTGQILTAFRGYIKHLHNSITHSRDQTAMASYIVNTFLPNLKTKNAIYLYSMNKDTYTDKKYYINNDNIPISFWQAQLNYFVKHKDIVDLPTILTLTRSHNHWIDDPVWEKMFWKTYNPILKLIGADNPNLII